MADSDNEWNATIITAEERMEMERRAEENDRKDALEMYEYSEEVGHYWIDCTLDNLKWMYGSALAERINDQLHKTFRVKWDYQMLGLYMQSLDETYRSKSRYYRVCSLDVLRFADVNLKLALENCLIDSYGVAEWWNDNHCPDISLEESVAESLDELRDRIESVLGFDYAGDFWGLVQAIPSNDYLVREIVISTLQQHFGSYDSWEYVMMEFRAMRKERFPIPWDDYR